MGCLRSVALCSAHVVLSLIWNRLFFARCCCATPSRKWVLPNIALFKATWPSLDRLLCLDVGWGCVTLPLPFPGYGPLHFTCSPLLAVFRFASNSSHLRAIFQLFRPGAEDCSIIMIFQV